MRIALISKRFPPERCGVGDYTYRLAQALAAKGDEVIVFTSPESRDKSATGGERPSDVRVEEIALSGWKDIHAAVRAIRLARPDRVQIEYSSYAWGRRGVAFWVNALVADLRHEELTVTLALHEFPIRIVDHPLHAPIALLQKLHIGVLALESNEVVTNTPERVSSLQRWLAWKRNAIHYRPNASNIPVTPIGRERRAELRAEHGARPETRVVATFSMFAVRKNTEVLIEALAQLKEMDARLWLLGDWTVAEPKYIAALRARIRELGLEERVFWAGPRTVEEISALLQAADLFVLPQADGHLTRSGGFMAAAAHGLATIAVKNAKNQAEFTHGENVWIVESCRAEKFAEAIQELADAARRERMGRALKALYEEKFAWEKSTEEMISNPLSVLSS